jgi:hypothetical protein
MAYELRGLLENNISIVTGENIRPSYGGDDEAFLKKVVTPIYRVIERVYFLFLCLSGKCEILFLDMNFLFLNEAKRIQISFDRKPAKARMDKHHMQLGVTMMISMSISG